MSDEKTTPETTNEDAEAKAPVETTQEAKKNKPQRFYKPGVPLIKAVAKGGVKLEFIASPTGKFGLAYSIGDKANFEKKQAEILIDSGVAKKA